MPPEELDILDLAPAASISLDDATLTGKIDTLPEMQRGTWQQVFNLFGVGGKENASNKSVSVTTDQASNTKYPSVKSVYDWAIGAFAKYLGDADFYKYSIVTSVASGNLTVTLLNYLGATPSATAPVKIQNQDGTIRTITSSCTATIASNGFYHFNSGSTELATYEIDYCVYIGTFGGPLISRKYHYRKISDGTGGGELAVSNTGGFSGTDTFVPIGRFNAIKASGATGNWSIPATSVIINSPIYETRWITGTPVITTISGSITTVTTTLQYKIVGDIYYYRGYIYITTNGTGGGGVNMTMTFGKSGVNYSVFSGAGRVEGGATGGKMIQVKTSGSSSSIFTYDNAYPGADGTSIEFEGFYNL